MTQIIIKTDTDANLIATAAVFFEGKKRLEEELKKMARIEQFYKKELNEVRNQYHTTRDGKVIHLSQMESSHLMNTAALLTVKFNSKVANKYANEIKKRGLANEYFALLDIKKKSEEIDVDEDEFTNEVYDF